MKIGNIYNLDAFKAFKDSAKAMGFKDSEAGTILARSLTHVDPRIFEKKYPELAFVNSGIQVDNSGGYARRIQSLRVQELGGFTTSSDASGNNGKISLAGEDSFIKVIERVAESNWTDSEIKEAELQNINLPNRYVAAHNGIYLREIDEAGLLGIEDNEGLLSYSGFATTSAPNSIENLDPLPMYEVYANLIRAQHDGVNNTPEYSATVVTTPVRCINRLQSTMMDTTAGTSSVLKALQDNFPGVSFVGTFRGDNAAGAGVSSTVAHSVNAESMVMRVPEPLQIGEIIKVSSFDFFVKSKYRVAGLDVLENSAGRRVTGL